METNLNDLVLAIEKEAPECVAIYRHIHQNPEIGLQEHATSQYLRDLIKGIEGVDVDPPLPDLPTAIIARITVPHPINCILLRCELDALPFKEQSGLPFSSTNGLHHACGHDGHMASLLVALKYTAKHRGHLKRSLVFCFQPGEEGKSGASKLFKAKPDLLGNVDECYAIHFMNAAYPGTIALGQGAVTALTSNVVITIQGKSAHCMMPHIGIDANFIGCTLVTQLYSLIGMKVPPLEGATLVVKSVTGGGSAAKVSNHFQLSASVRTTSMDSYQQLKSTITKLTEGLCSAYGAKPTIIFKEGNYRPVINNEVVTAATRKKLEAAIKGLEVNQNQKSFAGEDFCEFADRIPSCFIAVGSAPADSIDPSNKESMFPLHSPCHKLNEEVFKTSTKIWATLIFT